MLVRGAEPMEKRQQRGLFTVPGLLLALLLTCSFLRYPLILWITVLPPLSELIPLAAAERPSAASQ
jgi:hypothetical protein